jgi:hypothetical protein
LWSSEAPLSDDRLPLDRLTDIKWALYQHAYGPATDVPYLILALTSERESTRRHAHETLCQTIWHQGTVYQATAYAVPFLVELLTLPSVKDKDGILYMLNMLALGASYHDAHQDLNSYYTFRKSETFQHQLQEELHWVRATHDAVEQGIFDYLALLTSSDDTLAAMVPYTLSVCYKRAKAILPELRIAFYSEHRPEVRVSIFCGMAELLKHQVATGGKGEEGYSDLFKSVATDVQADPYLRLAASLALVDLLGKSEIVRARQCFTDIGDICKEKLSPNIPWSIGGGSVQAMSIALSPYPEDHMAWIVDTLGQPNFADTSTRMYLIWKMHDASRVSRRVARQAVDHLVRLVGDSDRDVAAHAAQRLAEMGLPKLAVKSDLERMAKDNQEPTATFARDALTRFQHIESLAERERRGGLQADCASASPLPEDARHFPLSDLLITLRCLDQEGNVTDEHRALLRSYLQNDWPGVRVLAARLLWTLGEDVSALLPVLTYDLHADPSGFLALESLARMGNAAKAAIPLLKNIAESDNRWHWAASTNTWNELDDRFAALARDVLGRIAD